MIFKLRTAVYPPRMALIGSKLCQNAFQVIPDVSFFDAKNQKKMRPLKVRLPPEDGSDWPETWPKRVSGDPRTFTFWRRRPKNFRIFRSRSFCFGQDTCVLAQDTCVLAQDTFFRNIFGAKNHTTGLIRVVWFHTTSWKSHTSHYVLNSMINHDCFCALKLIPYLARWLTHHELFFT